MDLWYTDENFWREFEKALFPPERWEAAVPETSYLQELLNLQEGSRILDLCCGPGRHALELARRGYRVTGVDRTFHYLKKLQRKALLQNLEIHSICADMKDFSIDHYFQAVISMFTSFGYFENPDDDRRVLENIYASLLPGGCLIMEMAGRDIVMENFQARDWHESHNMYLLEERELDRERRHIMNHWILLQNGVKHEFRFRLRLYSDADLSNMLFSCGFKKIDIFGGLDQSPYNPKAKRLVVRAEKGD
jgi:SAM-dependent methyltransferase